MERLYSFGKRSVDDSWRTRKPGGRGQSVACDVPRCSQAMASHRLGAKVAVVTMSRGKERSTEEESARNAYRIE